MVVRAILLGLGASLLCAQCVRDSLPVDPGALNFLTGDSYEQIMIQQLCGDGLTGLDAQGKVVPRLATRWERHGKGFRFWLREGQTFGDGSPVRLEDALWTLRALQGQDSVGPVKRALAAGVRARLDKGTLVIESDRPPGRLLYDLARLPIAKAGAPHVGCGPYGFSREGQEVVLRARPHPLTPRIPEIRFRIMPDPVAVQAGLSKGWLSVGVPLQRAGAVPTSHQELRTPTHAQVLLFSRVGPGVLRQVEQVREAVLTGRLLGRRAVAARGLLPETLGFPPRRMALEGATAFQGPVEVLYGAGDELVERALLALRARLKQEGLELVPRPIEGALLVDRVLKGQFQLACVLQVWEPHPWAVLDLMEPGGALNLTGWTHARFATVQQQLDRPDAPAWAELHALWAKAPTCLPLMDLYSVLWVDRRLEVQPNPIGLYLATPGAAGWRWKG